MVRVIFEEKKLGTASCAKLFKDPKSKIFLWHVAHVLGAGPQKIWTVTLKWAIQLFFKFTFLKVVPEPRFVP